MSKQQNYRFTKQDVKKAQKILTAVQEKDIEGVYEIVGLPSRIQQKLNSKTSIDAEKILTKQLSTLKKSYATDEEKYTRIDKNKYKELKALCEKIDMKKQKLEQVQKCLNLIHAINDISVSIEQMLDSSGISPRLIKELNIDPRTTTISEVQKQLENLLSTFNDPVSESDSDYASSTTTISIVEQLENLSPTFNEPISESDFDYTSSDDDFSSSENDSDHASSDDDYNSRAQHAVQLLRNILLTNNPQHPLLLKIKEAADKFTQELDNAEHHINNNDDVSATGRHVEHIEYNDTH